MRSGAGQQVAKLSWPQDDLPLGPYPGQKVLPFGNGRSYGDVCLNDGGVLLDTRGLDRLMLFDRENGILRCESGVLLMDIMRLTVPGGWFPAVAPGTQFVTVGGAVANDVHGKNHHKNGTFGCHVRCFELLRSDGTRLLCSRDQNADWYCASIGGLGLTGLITWVELQLQPIPGPFVRQETVRFSNLDAFLELSRESDRDFEHTVAWVDCLASGSNLGRGILTRGNFTAAAGKSATRKQPALDVPFTAPFSLVGRRAAKWFNAFNYGRQGSGAAQSVQHFASFFFPLDAIGQWNRFYGPRGLLQYQCVVPADSGVATIRELLQTVSKAGLGSVLAVLKVFGDRVSPGWMSFPRPGITLAMDFPRGGKKTLALLNRLDELVEAAHGAVYPAKDACMSPASFQAFFPRWKQFNAFVDERFSSSFWRRVSVSA